MTIDGDVLEAPVVDDVQRVKEKPLRYWVACSLEQYFSELEGAPAADLYTLVRKEIDLGILQTVMKVAGGNQSLAASWLGLARGTLRKKLSELGLDE